MPAGALSGGVGRSGQKAGSSIARSARRKKEKERLENLHQAELKTQAKMQAKCQPVLAQC